VGDGETPQVLERDHGGEYWHNGFFWLKLALFGLVFALELTPMMTFIRVRHALRRKTALPRFSVETYRRITQPRSRSSSPSCSLRHSWPAAPGCSEKRPAQG